MILSTARLTLRPLEPGDAPALFAMLGDPLVMEFWDRAALPRLATVQALLADELAAMAARTFFCWTVLKDGAVVGSIDLSPADTGARLGFVFRREVWGQGLAREALDAVIAHGLRAMGLTRLTAKIQTANTRAARLLAALGFQEDGPAPDVVRDGAPRPCMRFARSSSANGR